MKPTTAGLALVLAAFAVGAQAKPQITKVSSKAVGSGYEIAVEGVNVPKPKTFFLADQTTFIVQFAAPLTPSPSNAIRVDEAGLNYYKYVRYQPQVARVLLKVDKGIVPTITQEDTTWYIRVGVTTQETVKPVGTENAAMRAAIEELNKAMDGGNTVTTKNQSVNLLKPGQILSLEQGKAEFAESSYTSTIAGLKAPAPIGSPFKDKSVNFVSNQVNVLAVFEAFAKETGVNIVTSPDVSPPDKPLLLTVSLRNVDLDFAMTTVASLAGLRFTRIGNTFIVCHANDFYKKVGHIMASSGVKYESRVVELSSGEARQIRDATMQALPQDGPDGYYEILDPTNTERYGAGAGLVTPSNNGSGAATTGGVEGAASGGAQGGSAPATTGSATPIQARAKYITLVGEPRRLDVIEGFVRDMDKRISESFSLAGAANFGSVVVPVISGQTEKIKSMIWNLLEHNPRRADYSIEETAVKELAEGEESTKMLLIAGPKTELRTLEAFANSMDESLCVIGGIKRDTDPAAFEKHYEVVDLKYIEPNHAAFDLKNRVRGLYVTILPDPVTPGLSGTEKDEKTEVSDNTAGASGGSEKKAEIERSVGHEQMRLVLRGTKAQIAEAKTYLQSVDLPTRQVSVELRVMELTKEEAMQIGLDWSVLTGGRLTSFRMNQGLGGGITNPGHFQGHYQDNATTGIDVIGKLDQISNRNNLIARPNALITDGRSSHLFVGDTIRYIKMINASQNGISVEVGEVEVGVTVDMTARIGAEGQIALDLSQNFSLLQGFTPVPGGGSIPQTSDRKTNMFVQMTSGETIALGGLIQEQDRKRETGIPILKDIPILGHLFKRTDNSKIRTEVVFFVTAKVIDNGANANTATTSTTDGATAKATGSTKGN